MTKRSHICVLIACGLVFAQSVASLVMRPTFALDRSQRSHSVQSSSFRHTFAFYRMSPPRGTNSPVLALMTLE